MSSSRQVRVLVESETTRMTGKCQDCGEEHDGWLAVVLDKGNMELGVAVGDHFHPLESFSLKELTYALMRASEGAE